MSSMESFYGGRQGASFVIVKRFDGIDIPENTVYRVGHFAKDNNDQYFIVPLVEQTESNYSDYIYWGTIPKDGVTTVTSSTGVVSDPLPVEYAEGMKQCFQKGGATTSTVGYGEYVIIDTVAGLVQLANPSNGKIYRRGMNYDDDLGGAEYIGQVIGPKGDSPELSMTTVPDLSNIGGSHVQQYDLSNGGLVPGKYTDGGLIKYNDDLTYGWVSIKDSGGSTYGALIAFAFPYLVAEMEGVTRTAYYQEGDVLPPGASIGDKLPDNFDLFVDNGFATADRDPNHGDTGHSFYRRWRIKVPQGIKGESQTKLIIIPQKVRANTDLWLNKQSLIDDLPPDGNADADNYVVSALDDTIFNDDTLYPYNTSSKIIGVVDSVLGNCYAKLADGAMLQLTYVQTTYGQHVEGDQERIAIGDYNTVKSMWLDSEGILWVLYSDETIPSDPINPDNPIPWVTNLRLDQNGTFLIGYNNNDFASKYPSSEGWTWNYTNHTGTKIIHFIDHVTMDKDGTIHFWYSDGTETTSVVTQKVKYLDDVQINTGLDESSAYDFDGEGTGDQKVELIWNTGNYTAVSPVGTENPSTEGWYELDGTSYKLSTDIRVYTSKTYYQFNPDKESIGASINYIMEAIVTTYDPDTPSTPQNHLIVLYSDPAYRAWLATKYPDKIFTYTSQKFTEADPLNPGSSKPVIRNDWFDLGYVKGEPGGLHIIGEYVLNAGETYHDYLTDGVPPEDMPGNTIEERGWAYLITDPSTTPADRLIYTYDYMTGHDKWVLVGNIKNSYSRLTPLENGTHDSLVYDGDLYNLYDIRDNKLEIWVGPAYAVQGPKTYSFLISWDNLSDSYAYALFCKDKLASIIDITKEAGTTSGIKMTYEVIGASIVVGDEFNLRVIR